MRMAGATAFFTTFALPPIFIILFQLFSLFLSKKVVAKEMMQILSGTLGKGSAQQIRQTTRGFGTLASNWLIATAGFLFLVFVVLGSNHYAASHIVVPSTPYRALGGVWGVPPP